MRPGEVRDGSAAVVDQLDAPAALVLDPHEDDARAVARCQLLVRLVPFYQYHLRKPHIIRDSRKIYLFQIQNQIFYCTHVVKEDIT